MRSLAYWPSLFWVREKGGRLGILRCYGRVGVGYTREIRERIKEKVSSAEEESMGTKEKGQFIRT